MLLANLTQVDSGARALLQIGDDKIEGLYISKLVRSFCRSSPGDSKEDTFEHVASVLVNISKVEAGRKILLEPKRGLLKQAICQLDSSNPLKKISDLDVIGLNQLNWTSSGVKINSDGSQHQLESAQSVDITLYPAESIEIFWNFSAYTDKSLEQGDGIGMNRIMAITWIGDWPGSPKST
ncbi:hypothetical protein MUK42_09181 [Musa troglodytarum]|uniref:Protein HGH1 N-terminal domain-containing protein n=1 Tax=Musa troglodytarum TaxID=320322 RepID=A0A9E7G334_9LILI|nr:hypothetical protein MUK42_09181 [Musa troglodytarum]